MEDYFISQIIMGGWNFAPRNTAFCAGTLMSISQNTALFSLLGTAYGGDGRTTFGLPDLRSRLPVHQGGGPNIHRNYTHVGARGSVTQIGLQSHNIPAHTHTPNAVSGGPLIGKATSTHTNMSGGNYMGSSAGLYKNAAATSATKGGSGFKLELEATGAKAPAFFSNQNPILAVNFCMVIHGIFPSRS